MLNKILNKLSLIRQAYFKKINNNFYSQFGEDRILNEIIPKKKIGEYLDGKNVNICIENNSKEYNCNFINTIEECSKVVRAINKPNIKMMVDLGNAVMENDNWFYLNDYMDIIYNIDISHKYMIDLSEIHESLEVFNFVLKKNHYNKIINLEMLIKSNDEINTLRFSLNNFINIYHI